MNRREFIAGMGALGLVPQLRAQAPTAGIMQPVLKRGYDNSNTGANLGETILAQANVRAQGIEKVFSLYMEGDARGCEAAPLIVPSVAMDDGTTRDIVIACSMNNTVWCYDANDSDILWVKKLAVPVNGGLQIDAWQINDHWGVVSSPVIDATTNRLYAVAWTDPAGNSATGYWQMHVLNLKDGSRVCAPVPVEGTSNGQTWNKIVRKQRSSLILATLGGAKTVFFGAGTMGETAAGASGWVFAFDCTSNAFTCALATSAGQGGGIWGGGSSMVSDGTYLYAVTANGGFDGATNFGEAIIKIQYTASPASLDVIDWWAGWSDSGREGDSPTGLVPQKAVAKISNLDGLMQAQMTGAAATDAFAGWWDQDLGSGGMLLVPGTKALLASGKDGISYIANSADLGKTQPGDFANPAANYAKLLQPPQWYTAFPGYNNSPAPANPTALDFLNGGKTRHQHSCSVYYNSPVNGPTVFCGGENSGVRAWKISSTGQLTFLAQANEVASANVGAPGGMTGVFMAISANGSTEGTALLWAVMPYGNANTTVTNGRLLVYDPEHFVDGVMQVLWDSQAQNFPFIFSKFMSPVVSGGKLFLSTYDDQILVFGLA
jgi:hypothetical protein